MSFSTEVKEELCSVPLDRPCCIHAEAYGALLHATVFSHREIRLVTGNEIIMRRLQALLRHSFALSCAPRPTGQKLSLVLEEKEAIRRIFHALGYDFKSHLTYHLNRNLVEEECCILSYLRGAFLLAGTVAGPYKKCHLELRSTRNLSREETSLLLDAGLSPKTARRGNAYLLYFKNAGSIETLLARLGAPKAASAHSRAKAEKKLRNTVNRQVNCEAANVVRAATTAARQSEAIRAALARHGEQVFPEKLQETVRLRLAYPDDSLSELAARFDPPLSKPGLDYRLKKIMELATRETKEALP